MKGAKHGETTVGGAHYWVRRFRVHSHTVKLILPQFVKPSVKSPKNDPADAEAICKAVTRPPMRFVPVKEVEQQDPPSLHHARKRVVKARTAFYPCPLRSGVWLRMRPLQGSVTLSSQEAG
jgi:transposase